ncbi:hypothetical protein NFI96_030115 [Prochilodus magdalenae]|nr:hypothetical protein NFI96_030115 [Prochilodus magdalenae]
MAFLCGVSQAFRCDVDEGPYTKHSNPSRPPDGALAIRRQSIPGNVLYMHIYVYRQISLIQLYLFILINREMPLSPPTHINMQYIFIM